MNIRLLCVGRIRTAATRTLVDDFARRLKPFHTYEEIEVRAALGTDIARAITQDSSEILARLKPADSVWLLDREGTLWSSVELAAALTRAEASAKGDLTFVIGGAYGLDARVRERANVRWSLSPLTILHEWARLFVVEQLYRATKIRRNEPYHH